MPSYNLRPYQEDALNSIENAWTNGKKSALVVLPTGCGKTILFSAEIAKELGRGGRVLVLAHRNELLKQAHDKLLSSQGIDAVYESGKLKNGEASDGSVTIGSVQTLSRDSRLAEHSPSDYSLIIVDEAHHVASDTYKKVRNFFYDARLLGVTATPKRGDNIDVSSLFEEACSEYTMSQAIEDGYLSRIIVQKCPIKIDLSGVRMQNGDFSARDTGDAIAPYLEAVAEQIKQKAAGRKTIIFTPLVETAQDMSDIMNSVGIRTEWVSGSRPDAEEVMRAYEAGEYDCLVNAMLLTEGYDCPAVNCVVNLRPTRSSGLYTQIIGRGTRICEGKENLLILDFLWQDSGRGTLSPMSAIFDTESDEIKNAMNMLLEEAEGPCDIFALKEEAPIRAARTAESMVDAICSGKIAADNLMRMIRQNVSMAKGLARRISYLRPQEHVQKYAMNEIHEYRYTQADGAQFDVDAAVMLTPKRPAVKAALQALQLEWYFPQPWIEVDLQPPTDKQLAALSKMGFPSECIVSKLHAMKVMDVLITRSKLGLASFKQVGYAYLSSNDNKDAQFVTKKDGAKLMRLISKTKAWAKPSNNMEIRAFTEEAVASGKKRFKEILDM